MHFFKFKSSKTVLKKFQFRQKMALIEAGELEVKEEDLEFKYLSHEMKGEEKN